MSTSMVFSFQKWFLAQCDGEWEHEHGIKVETLDNPGWAVKINLIGTNLENINFTKIQINRSESDWVNCYVENNVFKGFGGPLNFEEILTCFVQFAHMLSELNN